MIGVGCEFGAEDSCVEVVLFHLFGGHKDRFVFIIMPGVVHSVALRGLAVTIKRQFAILLAEAAEEGTFFIDQAVTCSMFGIFSGFVFGNRPGRSRTSIIHGTLMSFDY